MEPLSKLFFRIIRCFSNCLFKKFLIIYSFIVVICVLCVIIREKIINAF